MPRPLSELLIDAARTHFRGTVRKFYDAEIALGKAQEALDAAYLEMNEAENFLDAQVEMGRESA